MKTPLLLLSITILFIKAAPAPVAVQEVNGLFVEENSHSLYTGFCTLQHPALGLYSEGKVIEGRKNGYWDTYFANGQMKCRELFDMNFKVRVNKSFYPNGIKETEYNETTDVCTTWYESGNIKTEGHYYGGLRDGVFYEWYENGVKKADKHFVEHLEQGLCIQYHPNGKVAEEAYYREGQKLGNYKAYYPNGKLKCQGEYTFGKQTGKWKIADEKGNITIIKYS
jgi:antitoxin component YwqK of YwqJK toxin-antitoxin module